MNTQRRIFRGRGGPTDRRLPKHNARRANRPKAFKPDSSKYGDDPNVEREEILSDDENGNFDSSDIDDNDMEEDELGEMEVLVGTLDSSRPARFGTTDIVVEQTDKAPSPCELEVKHLRKRVQNIRETLQLSSSIANPKTYQENVLNAVSNCVKEWRSIVSHYPLAPQENVVVPVTTTDDINQVPPNNIVQVRDADDQVYLTPELQKAAALDVFGMIQHSIQCGPLAGSKPGYFKRCGGDVAKVVVLFLQDVIPHAMLGERMGFSTKQMDAMNGWLKNAERAAMNDKPPSRTALQHQQGKSTGKKAKKKRKG